VISELHRQHRAAEWKKFLQTIDRKVPAGLEIHIVADNYATHKTPAIQAWLAARPRFTMHFTPTGSSWLNQAVRWSGEITAKMLRRGAHRGPSTRTLTMWRPPSCLRWTLTTSAATSARSSLRPG